ncbi:LLM class flavin-dependent oxidoreductase [Kitasatospora aureofaciens]|uniref:LLM class flavin-dependent oxidoreductase n=1 Tax=Kitasatospora aureofaciens TaxID=1894 RepID=UPI000524B95E|nr:LLM class flavin-dependent oxidoreductase [Kitasatospora aureofaciens]HJD84372.1 LLM class flavin-dependent oxidoreductase [Kitasatospora aureofaciens]
MKSILFYLPTVGSHDQVLKGMAGVNRQNYRNMLWQLTEQARAADELGYWGLSFTEHHFHVEGFEVSNNPIMLGLYLAMQTKEIRVGQMANVLPFHNPLRLAEDLAMLDHMTRGRTFVGIARGFQKRWAEIMGQPFGVGGTLSDAGANDRRNRALFEEHWEILKKAWTTETFSHSGAQWTIPPKGLEFPYDAVRSFGRGLDENGVVQEVGIAPKPYQHPHPPVFQPFSFSEDTFRFCAREGVVPILMNTDDRIVSRLMDLYREEAAAAGHGELRRGERIGVMKDVLVARDADEAHHWAARGGGFVFENWFGPMGFTESLRRVGETGPIGADYRTLVERGLEWVGTPDDINRKIEKLVTQHDPEYLLQCQYSGLIPHDVQMRSLELWATEIAPNWL